MLTAFWDQHGVVLMDFLSKGAMITGAYYASLLQKLREAIKTKRRGTLTKGVRLLQDNAPVRNSHVARWKHAAAALKLYYIPPYSPDLAPSDFQLFPYNEVILEGQAFSR
ncbi:hypothetical protein MTO96_035452 [Rhipicephalus appendiculatus]